MSENDVGERRAAGLPGISGPEDCGDLIAGFREGNVEGAAGHDDEDHGALGRLRDRGDQLGLLAGEEEAHPVEALPLDRLVGPDD